MTSHDAVHSGRFLADEECAEHKCVSFMTEVTLGQAEGKLKH